MSFIYLEFATGCPGVGMASCTTWRSSSRYSLAFPKCFGHQGAQEEQGTLSLAAFEHTESPLLAYLVLMEMMQAIDPKQGMSNGVEPLV